eukprot:8545848-Pyramimonas_sp.AAC.1
MLQSRQMCYCTSVAWSRLVLVFWWDPSAAPVGTDAVAGPRAETNAHAPSSGRSSQRDPSA